MNKACIKAGEKIWTLTYTLNENGTINILNFDSEDNDGYMFGHTLPRLTSIIELEGRVADRVVIDGTEYDVTNKQNVYTYKQPL